MPLDQRLNNRTIHLRHLDTNQRPQHEEETMANQQPGLLALPTRNHNPNQSHQRPEELPVQRNPLLGLLAAGAILGVGDGALASFALLGLARRGGFLLRDGVAHAVDEGDEEGEPDGAGDARAVGQVELG